MRNLKLIWFVLRFGWDMFWKLFKMRHKGNERTWRKSTLGELYWGVLDEASELRIALDDYHQSVVAFGKVHPDKIRFVCGEAVDVANFALMVHDKIRMIHGNVRRGDGRQIGMET